jgi:outer membrane lipoprotein-sorting protein
MTVFRRRPALRWLVPLVAIVLLAAGGSAVGMITATARSGLPERSAAALLVDVQKARLDGLSGTIVQNAELGLPSLPGVGGAGSSDLSSMVAGSHTLRLWYAGPDRVRVALLGSLGESDVVRNGTDLWTWSSAQRSATHRTVPASTGDEPHSLADASPMTPQQAADAALKAISPTTRVSTDGTAVVAGRPAYELLLQPRDRRSLVGSVRIAIDGKTHVPTRVQVFADSGEQPAFEVGFTSFDPTRPPTSVFRFNPPPGTKVTEAKAHADERPGRHGGEAAGPRPRIVGSGWTAVVVARVPSGDTSAPNPMTRALRVLPKVSGSWGSGRLLRGTLFSALLTDDGRIAVGAVAPDRLYSALAGR